MQQFLNVFKELEGKNLYLSGESVCPPKLFERRRFSFGCKQYASTYLPCLSLFLFLAFLHSRPFRYCGLHPQPQEFVEL